MFGAFCGACGLVNFLGVDCGIVLAIVPSNFGVECGSFVMSVNS